mmetsp:Transcript_29856/g.91644  ORF Transcript_29856/g.91644 Transcript_29856/m.91644 type:complete len:83 (+) Transcript_29856:766-1014(+)
MLHSLLQLRGERWSSMLEAFGRAPDAQQIMGNLLSSRRALPMRGTSSTHRIAMYGGHRVSIVLSAGLNSAVIASMGTLRKRT